MENVFLSSLKHYGDVTWKYWYSMEPPSIFQGILLWATRSYIESIGIVTRGKVSMAVRMPP